MQHLTLLKKLRMIKEKLLGSQQMKKKMSNCIMKNLTLLCWLLEEQQILRILDQTKLEFKPAKMAKSSAKKMIQPQRKESLLLEIVLMEDQNLHLLQSRLENYLLKDSLEELRNLWIMSLFQLPYLHHQNMVHVDILKKLLLKSIYFFFFTLTYLLFFTP